MCISVCSSRANLLNPCFLELNNVRMLQASNKGHLHIFLNCSMQHEPMNEKGPRFLDFHWPLDEQTCDSALFASRAEFSSAHTCKLVRCLLPPLKGKHNLQLNRIETHIILFLLGLVVHEDGSTKGATANLLHNLVLIHPWIHGSQSLTKTSAISQQQITLAELQSPVLQCPISTSPTGNSSTPEAISARASGKKHKRKSNSTTLCIKI